MNTSRRYLRTIVVLLVVVPTLLVGAYLIRQSYKRHHYITGTRQFGLHRGEHYRYTEEQQDEMNRRVDVLVQQMTDEQRERAMKRMHPGH